MARARLPHEPKLDCLSAAREFFTERFATLDPKVEILWVAHVNTSCDCLYAARYDGSTESVKSPIRAIISDVLTHDSTGLLLSHNHPSGDARPSDSDCRFTRHLACVAEALDCRLIDHIIVAAAEHISFREMGLL